MTLNLASFLSLLILTLGFREAHVFGDEDIRSNLDIRLVDVDGQRPDTKKIKISYEVYSAALAEPLRQYDVAVESPDGFVPIPKPIPDFGIIRIRVKIDTIEKGFRYGYAEYSYHLDEGKQQPAAKIELEQGDVVTGRVFDSKTSKPIPNAEVTKTVSGSHDTHPIWEWDGTVNCDREGRFRVAMRYASELAARGTGYQIKKFSLEKMKDVRLELEPLIVLKGRLVDEKGQPIAGARIGFSEKTTDEKGRFSVQVTESKFLSDDSTFSISLEGYEYKSIPLSDFDRDNETDFKLLKQRKINGVILDADGKPVVGAELELKERSSKWPHQFYSVGESNEWGQWNTHVDSDKTKFTLRVFLDGAILGEQKFLSTGIEKKALTTRLSWSRNRRDSFQITGRISSFDLSDANSNPNIYLFDQKRPEFDRATIMEKNGQFTFRNLKPGKFTLHIRPNAMLAMNVDGSPRGQSALNTGEFEDKATQWNQQILIDENDIDVGVIDLRQENLLPVRMVGVAIDKNNGRPAANSFGYICAGANSILDSSIGPLPCFFKSFMTDVNGRFDVEDCPPGIFAIRFSSDPDSFAYDDPVVWVNLKGKDSNEFQTVTVDGSFPQSQDEIRRLGVEVKQDQENVELEPEPEKADEPKRRKAIPAYWTPGKVLFITAIILIFTAIVGLVKRRDRIATINNGSNPPTSK